MNCKNNLNEFFLGIANATFMNYENAEGQEMDEKELLVIIPAYNEEKISALYWTNWKSLK